MTVVKVSRKIGTPSERVWAVLANYGGIHHFSPHVAESFIRGEGPAFGEGALRQCSLADGKNHIKERVTSWHEGISYTVDIYEGTMPMNDAYSTVSVLGTGPNTCQTTIEIGYVPKFGIFGRLLDIIALKPRLTKVATENLAGLEGFVLRSSPDAEVS